MRNSYVHTIHTHSIAHQVDPYFKELRKIPSDAKYMNYTSLEELFGHNIR